MSVLPRQLAAHVRVDGSARISHHEDELGAGEEAMQVLHVHQIARIFGTHVADTANVAILDDVLDEEGRSCVYRRVVDEAIVHVLDEHAVRHGFGHQVEK